MKKYRWAILPTLAVLLTGAGILITPSSAPLERSLTIKAKRYEYTPSLVTVNRGDTVRITLISEDVEHGFFLEGYDLDIAIKKLPPDEEPESISFVANRAGKFRFRCSRTCGYLHPFMQGELIVRPNKLYYAGIGLVSGILLGSWLFIFLSGEKSAKDKG